MIMFRWFLTTIILLNIGLDLCKAGSVTQLQITDNNNVAIATFTAPPSLTGYVGTALFSASYLKLTASFSSGSVTSVSTNSGETSAVATDGIAVGGEKTTSLLVGTNTLSIVHSEDGTYVITITKQSAVLTSLILYDSSDQVIALTPGFTSGTLTGYTGFAQNEASFLKIYTEFSSGSANATVDTNTIALTSNSLVGSAATTALGYGSNDIIISHSTDGDYIISVTRYTAVVSMVEIATDEGIALSISPDFTSGLLTGYKTSDAQSSTSYITLKATFGSGSATAETEPSGGGTVAAVTGDGTTVAGVDGVLVLDSGTNTLYLHHDTDGSYEFSITVQYTASNIFDFSNAVFLDNVTDLWIHLTLWTVAGVSIAFFVAGVMATARSKSPYHVFWLPLLMLVVGAAVGFLQGAISALLIAAIYISVPYAVGIDIAAGLGIGQALIITYFHLGRADFIHR